MKLDYYIKTNDPSHIDNFIKICKECNIPTDNLADFIRGDEYIGIGIFIKPNEITNPDNIKSPDDLQVDVSARYIQEAASWWEKIKISEYETFIREFDINEVKTFLYKKLLDIREKYPDVTTIGCKMISSVDLKYEFYTSKSWKPFILKSYIYSAVTNQWGPHTQKGYGDFDRFHIWDDKYFDMNKKQIMKHINA